MYADEFRQWRECCGLTMRDMEQHADDLANTVNDNKYRFSRAWLSEVERGQLAPQLHKLCALMIIYRQPLGDFPRLCGIDEADIIKYQLQRPLPATCPFAIYNKELADGGQRLLRLPQINPQFDGSSSSTEEQLIIGQGTVPLKETLTYDNQDIRYAFIGMQDQRMAPLVPAGAFIRIDVRQRQIISGSWPDELRPLYLVKIRNRYYVSWLEMTDGRLILLAHSLSGSRSLTVRNPSDAEVIGRVTGVTMKMGDDDATEQQSSGIARNRSPKTNALQPVREARGVRPRPLANLNVIKQEIASWGVGPLMLLQHVAHSNWHLGYIGTQDRMAFPRLRPGTWLRLDEQSKQVERGPWPSNYQRPFYFVKVPEGYACSWVERAGEDLILSPYPGSPCQYRRLRYGTEAQIIGRVTWAAMQLDSE